MQLFAFGLSHHATPLALRERIAFGATELGPALLDFRASTAFTEAAIVSTCNRTELYCVGDRPDGALEWLAQARRVPFADLRPHAYTLDTPDTVRHTFRLASGLDSMVLGETQILGQMKHAVRSADEAGALGGTLHRLFQRSFSVAKDVRTLTGLGSNVVSLSSAALSLAKRIFPTMQECRVLFVGAGEMIERCAAHFSASSPRSMTVCNRSALRGERLAAQIGADVLPWSNLAESLAKFDVVVTCTASLLPIIGKGLVERVRKERRRAPMVIVDLAVPRDVEPEVAQIPDMFLYSLDDLAHIVRAGAASRQNSAVQAESIVEDEVTQFVQWLHAREAVPLIRSVRDEGERARQAALTRAARELARGQAPEQVIERLSRTLTNKLLHAPTRALREQSGVVGAVNNAPDSPTVRHALQRALADYIGSGPTRTPDFT